MARSQQHTTNGEYTNPDVKFERTDVDARPVLVFGLVLGGLGLASGLVLVPYVFWLLRLEEPTKKNALPAAAVDQTRGLPPMPLEAIEDVKDDRVELFPPRAAWYFEKSRQELARGDGKTGALPIQQTMDELAGKLTARKSEKGAASTDAPTSFHIRLPSKAAAGRAYTGGQER